MLGCLVGTSVGPFGLGPVVGLAMVGLGLLGAIGGFAVETVSFAVVGGAVWGLLDGTSVGPFVLGPLVGLALV